MIKKMLRFTLASCLFLAPAISSHAGLLIDVSSFSPVTPTAAPVREVVQTVTLLPKIEPLRATSVATLEQIGVIPTNISRVTTSQQAQPLAKAFAALVPPGWSGYITDPRIKKIKTVEFHGWGRPWPVVIEEVLEAHGMNAKINWTSQEISFGVSAGGIK